METEVAVKLENHDQQIKSLKHRMEEQEEQSKAINDLVLSVQKLAINMERMLNEQTSQNERLQKLEQEPAKQVIICFRSVYLRQMLIPYSGQRRRPGEQ